MLLNDLYKIANSGASQPFELWRSDYNILKKRIEPDLDKLLVGLTPDSVVFNKIKSLIANLRSVRPKEMELADGLRYVANLFVDEKMPVEKQELIKSFIADSQKFFNVAKLRHAHRHKRVMLKKRLSPDDQKKYDLKLFQNEGMLYCLEYYLVMYKSIIDENNEVEKKKYIENIEVDQEFGKVPGLWIDFTRDEVLDKFIYSILDNKSRNNLIWAYYRAKDKFMKVKILDENGRKTVDYGDMTFSDLVEAFKHLCQSLLDEYQRMGIDRLASFFFKPYGNKPLIKDIKL